MYAELAENVAAEPAVHLAAAKPAALAVAAEPAVHAAHAHLSIHLAIQIWNYAAVHAETRVFPPAQPQLQFESRALAAAAG